MNKMKKVQMFFVKSLMMAVAGFMVVSCDDSSPEVPSFKISPIAKYEKDSKATYLFYHEGRITELRSYVDGTLVSSSYVNYNPSGITCSVKGIDYSIKWDATLGGARATSVEARIGGALYYRVEYLAYDAEGRLVLASIEREGGPYYVSYKYNESSVVIDEGSFGQYEIPLSSEENVGNVCNVLDYANAPNTSEYVINPDLYYLNIYGAPVKYLPSGHRVERSDGNLSQVGEYFYEYN